VVWIPDSKTPSGIAEVPLTPLAVEAFRRANVTQMLRQGNAQVMRKYSQMKLQMKRNTLEKLNRRAGGNCALNDLCHERGSPQTSSWCCVHLLNPPG